MKRSWFISSAFIILVVVFFISSYQPAPGLAVQRMNADVSCPDDAVDPNYADEARGNYTEANVYPVSGLNGTLFNFTLSLPTNTGPDAVRLTVGNCTRINVTNRFYKGNATVYHVEIKMAYLLPGRYPYSFNVSTANGSMNVGGPEHQFEIVSPIVSFMVLPAEGDGDTIFVFSVMYRDPSGAGPDHVNAAIDNGSHLPMRPSSVSDDHTLGVNYTASSSGKENEGLYPGVHSYYPVIWIDGKAYSPVGRGNVTFSVRGEDGGGKDNTWYRNECCTIFAVFLLLLLIFSVLHSLIMRFRKQKRDKVPSTGEGGKGIGKGDSACSRCGNVVTAEDEFCTRCGDTFEHSYEIMCPGCGGSPNPKDDTCPDCGFPIGGMAASRPGEIDKVSGKKGPGTVPAHRLITNGDRKNDDVGVGVGVDVDDNANIDDGDGDDDDFICSMCSATVGGRASRCPECGTEFE